MAKKTRNSWTQGEVAALVHGFASRQNYLGTRTPTEVEAKLLELGLIPKAEKPGLTPEQMEEIDTSIESRTWQFWDEPQRTLAVRYAIKSLQALLPKRPAK